MENKDYADKSYAKKTKDLCIYCSYREAVPSKNKLFCCELCRLLYYSIDPDNDKLNISDIAKLIKMSKIELIEMILNLKSQEMDKDKLFNIVDKKIKEKPYSIKKQKKNVEIIFD